MPIGRRAGRPGLIGTAARTAVIAGTAQATTGAIAHRQQARYGQPQPAAAAVQPVDPGPAPMAPPVADPGPPPAPTPAVASGSDDLLGQLQQLAQLNAAGVLTAEEFTAAKAKLLA